MIKTLQAALEASPSNTKVLVSLLRLMKDSDDWSGAEAAFEVAVEVTPEDEIERLLIAEGRFRTGAPDRALEILGDSASECLLRARCLAALDELEEAGRMYQRAVEDNPALEDLELKARLGARIIEPKGGRGPALRVISNDDTNETELRRLLEPPQEPVTFSDVGGLEKVKKQIHRKIILPFTKPSIFQKFKKKSGGGILMYGPPGCGKTLLARATAGECRATFFNVMISDILDMYIGESEQKLHAIFEKARSETPSVMFFDELEALAGKRQYTREGTSSKLVSQFLSEMDGFAQNNKGVLVLGATNVPWAIDSAFRRAGRFDRVLFVPPPDAPARQEILEHLLKDRPVARGLDTASLAKRTSGFSGADLANLVDTATDEAIEESLGSEKEVPIGMEHLREAQKEVKPTTTEWLTTARNYARYANEAGQYDEVLEFLRAHGKA